jgi:acetyl-CoA synthetase (ADP-forming)
MSTEDPLERALAQDRTVLTEPEAKALLAEVGIETLAGGVAKTPQEAVERAGEIGYPVVAKVAAPAVTHKSEWADGAGVAVGLTDADEVRTAAERILQAAAEQEIDASVYLEKAADVDAGTEVIVGGLRDASFGPTILVGLGGVFTEVYEDTAHRLAPVSPHEARDALDELQAMQLLTGYRDRPAADVEALAEAVRAVGDLLAQRDVIAEIDVNPVLATATGAVALDALVVLEADATVQS